ncbi:TadE/TadG family type IV pilus assembly protein [Maritalea mediterranea]|uniref:Pilus assembly protein n=1 Tax=Maritalea mediterranea TaxID=2909667 RepID=A0ABS9E3M3_9HYPH|nr:TadE/TadG family type IV pilus assembly protein [Maritalea mediterranea]MCF4097467.1 pilus assembly protein [Maritalea mediterranea]
MFRPIRKFLRSAWRNDQGISAVEFALILPVMLTLYLGTIDVSTFIIIDRKVAVVAGSVADLVARAEDEIKTSTIDDYFEAAEFTLQPYEDANLRQRVTSLRIDDDARAWVVWSLTYNGGSALVEDSEYVDIPPEVAKANRNDFLIMGEAWNSANPVIGYVFNSTLNFEKRYFFRSRFDGIIELN